MKFKLNLLSESIITIMYKLDGIDWYSKPFPESSIED